MRISAVTALIAALAAAPAMAATETHKPSGMQFPDAIGAWERVSVQKYDATGMDVSAGYNLRRGDAGIAVTFYVFPPRAPGVSDCEAAYQRELAGVVQSHGGAKPRSEGAAPMIGEAAFSRRARFEYTDRFAGRERLVTSDMLFYCPVAGTWVVQYRATWPAADTGAEAAYEKFLTDFRWTFDGAPRK